ncbi:MAG: hypothetical protein NZ898_02840 [Myxococcota bacterium]|nr:hypothetical protein [Myxococcota bacterium]MDW8361310.1 hypothetical protein [Myxococcales bacterium]
MKSSCAESHRTAGAWARAHDARGGPSRRVSAARGVRGIGSVLVCVGGVGLVGCYASHPCATEERCNYLDDDCDGRIDEDFLDAAGRYASAEHCGSCGLSCAAAFPTAERTECRVDTDEGPRCVLVACPPGTHPSTDGACLPLVDSLCLPCASDEACRVRDPQAFCARALDAGRCVPACDEATSDCAPGTVCAPTSDPETGLERTGCLPVGGDCECGPDDVGLVVACTVEREDGRRCAGTRTCGPDGFGPCEPVLGEACNGEDDDCDGDVDEDFVDEAGRYVGPTHCGQCGRPCAPPGPNMLARCVVEGGEVRCATECLEGFVDVDGVAATGCECERWDGTGPPPVLGGDADCDGVVDDADDYVYVAPTGNDGQPGTLARPMRTIERAVERARAQGKDVLVATGRYAGFSVVGGVDVYGGYRSDFRDRDLALYPVVLEGGGRPGEPVLRCRGVETPTRIEGFVVRGSDATGPGEGSTAVYLDACGPSVVLAALEVVAGRGAAGARGASSSERLSEWGLRSLADLDGRPGGEGRAPASGAECTRLPGGSGGTHACRGRDVGGGRGGDAACAETGCRVGAPCGNAGCTDFTVGGVCDLDAARRVAVSNPPAQPGRGPSPGAAGELTYNSPTNRGVCHFCDDNPTLPREGGHGGRGADGMDGSGGAGCAVSERFDPSSGRVSAGHGGDGADGTDGSGGGGGTAGAGYDVIAGTEAGCADRSGGSGGGGGSGGCGAPGARGGGGGGASVGIAIRLASGRDRGPGLEDVRVVTASGGDGGDGGIGADGGRGGVGGRGGTSTFWCARNGGRGGDGGRGGAGGGGGGGCGGGSYGVVIVGVVSDAYFTSLRAGLEVDAVGLGGRAGRGGYSPGSAGSAGRPGDARDLVVLR